VAPPVEAALRPSLSTADQLAAIAGGDRRAFEQLFREFGPRIFRFAFRLIRDREKAEEVVNDVMLEIWKSAGRFSGLSSPSTWILGITRHRTLNAVRGKTLHLTPLEQAAEIADERPDVAAQLDRPVIAAQLRAALDRLPHEQREVVELTFVHEMSYKEIAEVAHCPENTVKTRMFHAKKKLEPLLAALRTTGEWQ
jgi:RNA polymerase sigma-70 factor (ECF subfamily)